MNPFSSIIWHDVTFRITWTLAHSAWQGVVVVALLAILLQLLRRFIAEFALHRSLRSVDVCGCRRHRYVFFGSHPAALHGWRVF
jgi:hypothetical protein